MPIEYLFLDITISPDAQSYGQTLIALMQPHMAQGFQFAQIVPVHGKFVLIMARAAQLNTDQITDEREDIVRGMVEPLIPFRP